jgi:hypothetical protein
MDEVIFLVQGSDEGGYTAQGIGTSIFTESETLDDLRQAVKDAIRCHFDENKLRLVLWT